VELTGDHKAYILKTIETWLREQLKDEILHLRPLSQRKKWS
jgi:hypothetical protein